MKKFLTSLVLCFTIFFAGCFLDKSIKSFSVDIDSQTLLIGESIDFHFSKNPFDSEEKILISCTTPDIVSISGNTITATNVGETEIFFKTEKKSITQTVTIRVLPNEEPNIFTLETSAYYKLIRGVVDIRCRYYNKNFWGNETDAVVVSGYGIIIETLGGNAFFVTDKNVFLPVSGREYAERSVVDYSGTQYKIDSYLSYTDSDIAVGFFVSNSIEEYYPTSISQKTVLKGDYVIRADVDRFLRITNIDENHYYISAAVDRHIGVPILNLNGDLIGLAKTNDGTTTSIINQNEIKRIVDKYFEGK